MLARVGGREVGSWEFQYGVAPTPIDIKLPAEATASGEIALDLSLPDAVSPKELGFNEDDRKLGVKLKSFMIRR
jgi:hypothetical protein